MSKARTTQKPDAPLDKRIVLFVTSLASFLTSVMGSALNIALPSIGHEYSADAITLSWISTIFVLVAAMFLVPAGRMADIYGRKKMFMYGVIGWTVTSVLCGLATSVPILIGFRALQAISGALLFGNSTAIVTSVYPPHERGRALGINVAAVYIGLSVGPSLGGIMTQQLGWRSMFFANAVFGMMIVYLIITRIKAEWTGAKGETLDVFGSVMFAVALAAVMYGFSVLPAIRGAESIAAGLAALVLFVWWEGRVSSPVLNINLFRHNLVFALSNLAALTNYAATFAISFLMSLYLQYVRGLDAQTSGLVLLSQPIVMFLFSPLAGRLSDRIEPRIVSSSGMFITTVGLALLALASDLSPIPYFVGALVIAGFGFALFSSPNTNAVMSSVERHELGVASATLAVMRNTGQMLSMGIATLVLAIYVGGVQITPDSHETFTAAFSFSFTVFATLCFLGIFCSLARGKVHNG